MNDKKTNIDQTHSGTGHNVAGDMNVYNFGSHDLDTDLALAVLIGSWDESKDDDLSTVEFITNEKYNNWVIKIRKIEAIDNTMKHLMPQ